MSKLNFKFVCLNGITPKNLKALVCSEELKITDLRMLTKRKIVILMQSISYFFF